MGSDEEFHNKLLFFASMSITLIIDLFYSVDLLTSTLFLNTYENDTPRIK